MKFTALCSQPTFSKSEKKSPPRKSKMDIFKMSKIKNLRILSQITFLIDHFSWNIYVFIQVISSIYVKYSLHMSRHMFIFI